jgi:hypothetical protein
MKNVAFHANQLSERGTEVAMYDYAHFNEVILKNKSFIISDKNANMNALKKFESRFEIYLYEKFEDAEKFVLEKNISHCYFIKSGEYDGKIFKNSKNLIHAVFQKKEFHGDKYVYVSQWLAEKMGLNDLYLPHIVYLPPPNKNIRTELGIPENATVIGRHGGYDEFNLNIAIQAVLDSVQEDSSLYFIFMNTRKFCNHKNIIFLDCSTDLQDKSNFINSCDATIHARYNGESFGLAICEFLFFNKPVISFFGGLDHNHIHVLKNKGLWYSNYEQCKNQIKFIKEIQAPSGFYSSLVDEFKPDKVMKKFNQLFLN